MDIQNSEVVYSFLGIGGFLIGLGKDLIFDPIKGALTGAKKGAKAAAQAQKDRASLEAELADIRREQVRVDREAQRNSTLNLQRSQLGGDNPLIIGGIALAAILFLKK